MRLRIRTEASAQAPVVATATSGEKLLVLEDRGAWVRVQDPDGLTGWTERNSLERTAERERRDARFAAIRKLPALSGIVSARAQLYAGPGIFYPLVGELPAEAQVHVFTRDHDFFAIDHDGGIAYVDVDAIDISAAGTRQLEVNTANAPATTDTTSTTDTAALPPQTASAPESVPEPAAEAPVMPRPEAPVAASNGGVYPAVPPGGSQPEELERVVPRYPPLARRANVAGSVVIRGIVRRDGTIDDVEIIKDLPYGLGDAARDAVSRWRFRPAMVRGEPIDVYYTVTVNFRLQ
jgi:protein TonB